MAGIECLGDAVALEAAPEEIDTIIVAGGSEDGLRRAIYETNLIKWLKLRSSSTRRLASVCTGAFALAAGGFLDGKRATTHWNSVGLLQELRPQIKIEPDAIIVAEHPVYTLPGLRRGLNYAWHLWKPTAARKRRAQSRATWCCSCAGREGKPSSAQVSQHR